MENLYLNWHPIHSAPVNGSYILLLGNSGYTTTPYRLVVGRWNEDKLRWENHSNDAFTDDGDEPFAWTEWCVPPANIISGIYEANKIKSSIKIKRVEYFDWECPHCTLIWPNKYFRL